MGARPESQNFQLRYRPLQIHLEGARGTIGRYIVSYQDRPRVSVDGLVSKCSIVEGSPRWVFEYLPVIRFSSKLDRHVGFDLL